MKITGKPVSSGITMNNIYKLIDRKIDINNDLISNIDKEISKFHNALRLSNSEIEKLIKKASSNK